jgi:hypothetical protein
MVFGRDNTGLMDEVSHIRGFPVNLPFHRCWDLGVVVTCCYPWASLVITSHSHMEKGDMTSGKSRWVDMAWTSFRCLSILKFTVVSWTPHKCPSSSDLYAIYHPISEIQWPSHLWPKWLKDPQIIPYLGWFLSEHIFCSWQVGHVGIVSYPIYIYINMWYMWYIVIYCDIFICVACYFMSRNTARNTASLFQFLLEIILFTTPVYGWYWVMVHESGKQSSKSLTNENSCYHVGSFEDDSPYV